MFLTRLKWRTPLLLLALFAAGRSADRSHAADRPADKLDLTPENFSAVRALVRPQGNEWRHLRVHWHTDIVAARKKAAREDKPILLYRTGGAGYNSPLGVC
jgi:hypothetical protein